MTVLKPKPVKPADVPLASIAQLQAEQAAAYARFVERQQSQPPSGPARPRNTALDKLRAKDAQRRAELDQAIARDYQRSAHPHADAYEAMRYSDGLDDVASLSRLRFGK